MRRAITGFILTCCACWLTYGQSAEPAFEVASIKPGTPPDTASGRAIMAGCRGGPGSSDPGRITCENISLANFISTAYGLKSYQFAFEDWMHQARFDITAKVPAGSTREQVRLMEQNLLADRFKLAAHFEKKEMQVYELVVGKNGPKLKEAAPEAAPAEGAQPLTPSYLSKLQKDENGLPILPCRPYSSSMSLMGERMRMQECGATMESLASTLSGQLKKPVTDATGLKGKYDIVLTFSIEGTSVHVTPGPGEAPDPLALAQTESAPTLLEAVQQQLGLKLEQKKGSVDILVIDHVEKAPTVN